MPRSLYRRIYMHFLGVLLVVGAVTSFIFAGGFQRSYLTDAAEQLAAHTASLLAHTPSAERARLATQLARELQLDLVLYDGDGRTIVHAGHALPPLDARSRGARPTLLHDGPRWFVAAPVHLPDGPPQYLLCAPARLGGWPFPKRSLLSLVILLALVGVAIRPLARRISRPIERLIEASRRFGNGDLSTRVELPRHPRRHHRHHRRWARDRHGDPIMMLMCAWNDMAERIERQVGVQRELLANVSHELRSPLARVRVALALLPEDEASRKRIADIEADLAELDDLIEEILQTSRLEATGLPTHSEHIPIASLFDEVLSRTAVDPLTAPLAATLEPSVASGSLAIEGDRALLRRALFNLVENAAKYGAAPVTLGVRRDESGLQLTVTDAGPGIPARERERMLRPFVRGERAHTPGRGGVGLGLSFAARVAAVHGGRLELDDAAGRGLVVRLWLPTARVVSG